MSIRRHRRIPSVTPASFDQIVVESPIPVLVSFQAPWSTVMVPLLDRLTETFAGQLRVVHVNVVDYPELAARFKIRAVPTLLIFKDGMPIEFIVGTVPTRFIFETVCKVLGVPLEPQMLSPSEMVRGELARELFLVHRI